MNGSYVIFCRISFLNHEIIILHVDVNGLMKEFHEMLSTLLQCVHVSHESVPSSMLPPPVFQISKLQMMMSDDDFLHHILLHIVIHR